MAPFKCFAAVSGDKNGLQKEVSGDTKAGVNLDAVHTAENNLNENGEKEGQQVSDAYFPPRAAPRPPFPPPPPMAMA